MLWSFGAFKCTIVTRKFDKTPELWIKTSIPRDWVRGILKFYIHSVLQKPCQGKKVSEALERKSNNLEPFTTLFNRLFEEIISLRSYVNEQLENIKKSPYDSKQLAKCDLTNYNTYVKRIDLKQKWKKYCLIKKTLSLSLAGNIVSKVKKGSVIRK